MFFTELAMDKGVATSTHPNTLLTHVKAGKAFGEPFVVMAVFGD
ncbi:hypothetical protein [Salinivibrio sp. ES.052]|nr:hypothetical protein [Salinivibrio sp. ES.052]